MRFRTLTGLVLFIVGYAALMAAPVLGELLPPERYETSARDLLSQLAARLDDRIALTLLQIQSGLDEADRVTPLEPGLAGQRLFDALDVPDDVIAGFRTVDLERVQLEEYDAPQRRYRIVYFGGKSTDAQYCHTHVELSSGGRWNDSITRRATRMFQATIVMLLAGGVVAAIGLWFALSTILVRALVRDMIVSSIAGIIGLTVVLFLGATLQFIDRFSFLGPGFFLSSIPMLIRQVLPYTIAFGVLAGATMVFGRMANAREELILQFNGVRLQILFVPIIIVGTLFTGATFHAAHFSAPEGAWEQDQLRFRVLAASLDNLPSGSFAFGHDKLPFAMAYRNREDNGTLHGLTLMFTQEVDGRFRPRAVFCARAGRVIWSHTLSQVSFELEDAVGVMWNRWPEQAVPRSFFAASLTVTQTVFASERSQSRMQPGMTGDDSMELLAPSPGIEAGGRRPKTQVLNGLYRGIERDELRLESAQRQLVVHEAARKQQLDELRRIRREQIERLFAMLSPEERRRMAAARELERPGSPLVSSTLRSAATTARLDATTLSRLQESLAPLLDRAAELYAEDVPPAPAEWQLLHRRTSSTELWRRWTVAFAPLLFVFVALPLGLLIRQGNLLVAFMSAVVLVTVAWFLPLTNLERMARDGQVTPEWVVVGPTAVVALTALVLFALAFRGGLLRLRRGGRIRPGDPGEEHIEHIADPVAALAQPKKRSPGSKTMTLPKAHRKAPKAKRIAPAPGATSNPLTHESSAFAFIPPPRPRVRRRLVPEWLSEGASAVMRAIAGGTIERHVLRGTLVSLGAAMLTVVVLFVVADAMTNADWFRQMADTRDEASYQGLALAYYSARVPQIMYMVAPLITAFALAFTLTRIVRSNEYLILQASGVSTWRVLRPMMLVALGVTLAMLAYSEWGAPWWAGRMDAEGLYQERNAEVSNRVLTDNTGRIIWMQEYDTRRFVASGMMMVGWEHDDWPPHVLAAWPVTYSAAEGWRATAWRELSLTTRTFEGEEVHFVDTVAQSTPEAAEDAPQTRPDRPERSDRPHGSRTATVHDARPLLIDPATNRLNTPMRHSDINKRVTQILEDQSISELWNLSLERPDWNAPQVMIHRALIYPLSNLLLFLIGMPLVLRVAARSAWHGTGICLFLGVAFYGVLISLTGLGLYTTTISPAVVLWLGVSPFAIVGLVLFRDAVQ
ncbi:MAG: LptF/LptG family permease [Planctomycetota bacterium]